MTGSNTPRLSAFMLQNSIWQFRSVINLEHISHPISMEVAPPLAHTFFPQRSRSRFAPEHKAGLRPSPRSGAKRIQRNPGSDFQERYEGCGEKCILRPPSRAVEVARQRTKPRLKSVGFLRFSRPTVRRAYLCWRRESNWSRTLST